MGVPVFRVDPAAFFDNSRNVLSTLIPRLFKGSVCCLGQGVCGGFYRFGSCIGVCGGEDSEDFSRILGDEIVPEIVDSCLRWLSSWFLGRFLGLRVARWGTRRNIQVIRVFHDRESGIGKKMAKMVKRNN